MDPLLPFPPAVRHVTSSSSRPEGPSRARRLPRGWSRLDAGGLLFLLGFTVTALVGYGVFGLHPERIPESLLGFWRVSYAFFAQLHILIGAGVLVALLVARVRARWIGAFVAVYLFSFLAEYWGTGYGLPFGHYEYSSLLGHKLGGRVPWVIPLSWFLMALPAWIMARTTFPRAGQWLARIGFAAVLLTLWDLALDPAMAYQSPYYWVWGDTGPYYKMPWINLAGWLGTGVVLMGAMELLGIRTWGRELPVNWMVAYYGITLLMPLGMIILEGLWIAVLATVLGYVAAWGVHLAFRPRQEGHAAAPAISEPPAREGAS